MKKIDKDTAAQFRVRVTSTLLAWVGALGLFFLGDIVRTLYFHVREDRLIGLVGAFVTCAGSFLVAYERCTFSFDRQTRILTWSRRRGLWNRSGTVPFRAITGVVLQSCMGNDRYYPKHRVVLMTSEGEVPLTVGYEYDDMNQEIAERIRAMLAMDSSNLVEESVAALAAQGRVVDAIRLLREKEGGTLTEAQGVVECKR